VGEDRVRCISDVQMQQTAAMQRFYAKICNVQKQN